MQDLKFGLFLKIQTERAITALKKPVFGVFLVRIQSKCGKIRTRKIPNADTTHAVDSTSLDSFHLTGLYTLKTSENQRFSDVLREFRKRSPA